MKSHISDRASVQERKETPPGNSEGSLREDIDKDSKDKSFLKKCLPNDPVVVTCYLFCLCFLLVHMCLVIRQELYPTEVKRKEETKNLREIEFPALFKVCVKPSFNEQELNKVGYNSAYHYFKGTSKYNSSIHGYKGHTEDRKAFSNESDVQDRIFQKYSSAIKEILVGTYDRKNYTKIPINSIRLRQPNYPNNCLTMDLTVLPQLKGSHIEMVFIKFNTRSFATEVKIEIEDRLSQVNRRNEFSRMKYAGPDVEIKDLHNTVVEETYLISFDQTIYSAKDDKINCTNYPTERFKSYEECDDFHIGNKIVKTGFPVKSLIDHDVREMNTEDKEAAVTLENYIRGRIFNDCRKPCTRTNIKSSYVMNESYKKKGSQYPAINIDFNPTVQVTTHYFPNFSFLTVMTSLGSSMGLWLGLSLLQLLFVITRPSRDGAA